MLSICFLRTSWLLCGRWLLALSLPSIVVRCFSPPGAILGLTHSVSGLTLWSFLQRRAQFSQFMTSNSPLTMSRYLRLMALASVELLCTTPLAIFQIVLNATAQPLDPWVSWDDTHYDFSRVRAVPAVIWNMNRWSVIGIQFNRWSPPFCALIFFIFFGFAAEARKYYRSAISKILVVCRLKRDSSSSRKTSPGSDTLFQFTYYPLTLLSSLRKLILVSSSTTSPALPAYIHPPHYQPTTPATTLTSSDDNFAPRVSAGTVSEFAISAYEKPLEPEFLPRIPAGSLSSRASSKSVVDYVV